mmetsp:Transcript_5475/g.18529  ORF Transcript_5475/g.18529 Transcript_5475/m.18529 type:complete len:1324 (+) Transcript_5475:256-4227(+)
MNAEFSDTVYNNGISPEGKRYEEGIGSPTTHSDGSDLSHLNAGHSSPGVYSGGGNLDGNSDGNGFLSSNMAGGGTDIVQSNGAGHPDTEYAGKWAYQDYTWDSDRMVAKGGVAQARSEESGPSNKTRSHKPTSSSADDGEMTNSAAKRVRLATQGTAGPMLQMIFQAEASAGLHAITLGKFEVEKAAANGGNSPAKGGSRSGDSGGKKPLPGCQVADCEMADLKGLKDYHLRYKICEFHLKAKVVSIDGILKRFCQQCGRFHDVTEFDENKRSCRAGLDSHNVRRRKMQWNKAKKNEKKGAGTKRKQRDESQSSEEYSGTRERDHSESSQHRSISEERQSSGRRQYSSDEITFYRAGSPLPSMRDMGRVGVDLFEVVDSLSEGADAASDLIFSAATRTDQGESSTPSDARNSYFDPPSPVTQDGSMSSKGVKDDLEFTSGEWHDGIPDAPFGIPGQVATSTAPDMMFPELPEDLFEGLFSASDGGGLGGDPLGIADMVPGGAGSRAAAAPFALAGGPGALGSLPGTAGLAQSMLEQGGAAAPYSTSISTGAVNAKLYDITPGDLAPEMQDAVMQWLQSAPDSIKSCVRPGCTMLTIDPEVRDPEVAARLVEEGVVGLVESLLSGPARDFFQGIEMQVQFAHHLAIVDKGEILQVVPLCPEADQGWHLEGEDVDDAPVDVLQPVVESIVPIAVLSSSPATTFAITGSLPRSSVAGVTARINGQYARLTAAVQTEGSYSFGLQKLRDAEEGALLVEVADGDVVSEPKPVLACSSPKVVDEVRSLEAAVADGHISPSDADALVYDLGCVLPEAAWEGLAPAAAARRAALARQVLEHALARGWHNVAKALFERLRAAGALADQAPARGAVEQCLLTRAVRSGSHKAVRVVLRQRAKATAARLPKACLRWIGHPAAAGPAGLTPLHVAALLNDGGQVADLLTTTGGAAVAWFLARADDGRTPAKFAGLARSPAGDMVARSKVAAGLTLVGKAIDKSRGEGGGGVDRLRQALRLVGELRQELAGQDPQVAARKGAAATGAAVAKQLLCLGISKAQSRGEEDDVITEEEAGPSTSSGTQPGFLSRQFSARMDNGHVISATPFADEAGEKAYVAEVNRRDRKMDLICYGFLYMINLADVFRLVRTGSNAEIKTVTTVAMISNLVLTCLIFAASYCQDWYVKRREPVVMVMRVVATVWRSTQLSFILHEQEHYAFALIQSLASCFYRVRMFRHWPTQLLCFPISVATVVACGGTRSSMHMGMGMFLFVRVLGGLLVNCAVACTWEARDRKAFLDRHPEVLPTVRPAGPGRGSGAPLSQRVPAFFLKYWGRIA